MTIEAWVDDPMNYASIMQTDIDEIKQRPAVHALLREYANYGQPLMEKLMRHLEFLVENRKQYYKAASAAPSRP